MSKKAGIGILILISLASSVFAAVYTDGIYSTKPYIAPASAVVDLNAGKESANSTAKVVYADMPAVDVGDALKDVSTNFNFDVNAQQSENQPVSQVTVAANFTANKGPAYVQYSHTRSYSRAVDPYFGTENSQFQGIVNNRVTFGVNLIPDFSKGSNIVASNGEGQKASTVGASAIVN